MPIAIGVFGALIGSFLNVVVYRVPAGVSIVAPPSACPHCGHRIRWYDNIPVISWLLLRGRCRDCAAPISWRYPVVELAGALFFAGVAVRFVPEVLATSTPATLAAAILQLVAFLYLAAISIALALIDLDTGRLPNVIVLPAYLVGAVLLIAAALLLGDPMRLVWTAVSAAALFLFYFIIAVIRPDGMGLGDVKLAGVLGMFLGWLGWGPLAVGAFFGFLLGGVVGLIVMAIRRTGLKTKIPYGPWLLAGAWVGIFVGAPLANWYLSLFGLA